MAQGFEELGSPPRDSHTVCWLAARQLILVKVFSGVLLARTLFCNRDACFLIIEF